MILYDRIIEALWFILPAYMANALPLHFVRIPYLRDFSTPVDFGWTFQGKRIFGNGKTWRGLIFGVLGGTLIALLQIYFQGGAVGFFRTATLPEMTLQLGFMLSLGALVGDLIGSFVKRQAGFKRGEHAPLLDQLDFVFGAYFFSYLLTFVIDYDQFFVVLIITPSVHLFFNFIAWIY